jgi:hypothetical protein
MCNSNVIPARRTFHIRVIPCTNRMHAAVYRIGHVSHEIFDLYGDTTIRFFRKGYIQIRTVRFVLIIRSLLG